MLIQQRSSEKRKDDERQRAMQHNEMRKDAVVEMDTVIIPGTVHFPLFPFKSLEATLFNIAPLLDLTTLNDQIMFQSSFQNTFMNDGAEESILLYKSVSYNK